MEATSLSQSERTTTLSTPTDSTTSGQSSKPSTEQCSDPTEPRPGNSDDSTSRPEAGTRDLKTESGWGDTSPSPEDPPSPDSGETPPSQRVSMRTASERSTTPPLETVSWMPAPEPKRSNAPSLTYSSHSHWQRETVPTWTEQHDFNTFNQDPKTFGWADEENEDETALDYGAHRGYTSAPHDETALDYGDYRGYTSAPHFYHQPFPLPDSPTYAREFQNYPPTQHHAQRIQGYCPPQYGLYPLAGQNSPPRQPGGSNDPPPEPPRPSNEERLRQAQELLAIKDRQLAELRLELETQQAERDVHAELHQLNDKGKKPDRPTPNHRRPLNERTD
ncbi:uncharacterized protein ARMOST_17120 [Armillaria ostoyae]|uniref:Uncharacterized protein n=1 Tax=Armillaria ostoyae TaxID=47428 RepID=A0A284RY42_ARMOS|nr:uncharacterized protein ARMOST_17120 [Armillaria ostoyae]